MLHTLADGAGDGRKSVHHLTRTAWPHEGSGGWSRHFLQKGRQQHAHHAGQHRDLLAAGVRGNALLDTMRCPEDNLLKGLIGHGPGLGLDAEGVQHVSHARADDLAQLLRFGAHPLDTFLGSSGPRTPEPLESPLAGVALRLSSLTTRSHVA